jgi:multifunctional cyclase/dehydratase/O-methyltransferase
VLYFVAGAQMAHVVYALAELGVAEELARRPRTVEQLATATGTDAPALSRLLRAAASVGVLAVEPDGRYAATPLSHVLRTEHPGSVKDLLLYDASELVTRPWRRLADAVRTGERAFDAEFGVSFFEYLAAHPDAGELFDRAMTQMSMSTTAVYLNRYDFGQHRRVADLGGGRGYFLAMLLQRYPSMSGVLVDRPPVAAEARALLKQHGVDERVTVVAGDFLHEVPAGCDAYVLKNVLHDWSDEDALPILRAVRSTMDDSARLLVCESVLAPPGQPDLGALLDLDMMLKFGGLERDLDGWRGLLHRAGFDLVNDPDVGTRTVLVGRPA